MKSFFPPASLGLAPLLQFSSILLQAPEHTQPPARGGVADRQQRRRDSRGRPGQQEQRGPGSAGQSPVPRFPSRRAPAGVSGRRWFPAQQQEAVRPRPGSRPGRAEGPQGSHWAAPRSARRAPAEAPQGPRAARTPRAAPAPLPVAGGYEWAQRKHRPPRT